MGIDRWGRLYYNPAFVLACSVDEIASVCLHEIGHKLRHHHDRAAALGVTEATKSVANVAMDCELNDDIADEVSQRKDLSALPGDAVYPSQFGFADGQLWEVYYSQLMDKFADQRLADGDGDGGDGEDGDGKTPDGGDPKRRKHECGSGAHGVPQPWEDLGPSDGGGDGIEDADWIDIERRVAGAIGEEHAKGRGTVPGTWVSWAIDILRTERIPWDQELSGAVRGAVGDCAGKVVHSYRRPSRRQQAVPNVVFPAMRRPIPNVAFVGDTSGSMSDDSLALVRGVVEDVCASLGASLSFIATDAAAHGVQRATNGRSIEMRGRGGTDMRVGLKSALEDVRPRPDVIICASDCETLWPEDGLGTRLIICAIEAHEASIAQCPEWSRVIVVRRST